MEEENASVKSTIAFKHISQVQQVACGLAPNMNKQRGTLRVNRALPLPTSVHKQTPSQSIIKAHSSEDKGKEIK